MIRHAAPASILLIALTAPLVAQAPDANPPEVVTETAPPAPPRTMPGSWEFSNADREKTCTITFRNDAAKVGKRVDFDTACVKLFPFFLEIAGVQLHHSESLFL